MDDVTIETMKKPRCGLPDITEEEKAVKSEHIFQRLRSKRSSVFLSK